MAQNSGSFGTITYNGNTINIQAEPNTLGDIAITAADGRIECYWDGNQWVCNSISFNQSSNVAASERRAASGKKS